MPALALLLAAAASQAPGAPPAEPQRHLLAVADGASLELAAAWDACRASTYGIFDATPALRAPRPAEARRSYGPAAFRALLPSAPVALGEVWEVEDEAALAFLRQFHAGARSRANFFGGEAPGTRALLRAAGPDAFEILLRTHASFILEDGVSYKPAQFEGRLVLGRADGGVRSFTMALPSRDPNVDVNVPMPGDPESILADIGWVPRMELAGAAAAPASPGPVTAAPVWTSELTLEDARLALRRAFYPFAALDWLPFEEAVAAARARELPLHLVVLFGCLDDDSC